MFNKPPQKDTSSLIQDLRQSFDSFSTQKQPQAAPAPRMPGGAPACSIIDTGLVITGNLQSDRDVQVDGEINGDVNCSHLTVSKGGNITGNIVADEVVIRGKVNGTIHALQVVLQDTAHVESDIFHNSLIIEQGAIFDGQSQRQADPKAQAQQLRAATKKKASGERSEPSDKDERAA
jgi:cytoskeletal protein CcmA (bactofilin family)